MSASNTLALSMTVGMALSMQAHAVVRYEVQGATMSRPGDQQSLPDPIFRMEFTVSDAAVSRGRFSISGWGDSNANPVTGRPQNYGGDIADFTSLRVSADYVTPYALRGRIDDFTVAFDADGEVTGLNLRYRGDVVDARLSGSGGNWFDGTFNSDGMNCSGCLVAGRIEVPEPFSLALVGVGLAGLFAVRSRAARQ